MSDFGAMMKMLLKQGKQMEFLTAKIKQMDSERSERSSGNGAVVDLVEGDAEEGDAEESDAEEGDAEEGVVKGKKKVKVEGEVELRRSPRIKKISGQKRKQVVYSPPCSCVFFFFVLLFLFCLDGTGRR